MSASLTDLERSVATAICMAKRVHRLPPNHAELLRIAPVARAIIADVLANTQTADLADAICNRVHSGHILGAFAFIRTKLGGRMSIHVGDLNGLQALAKEAFQRV